MPSLLDVTKKAVDDSGGVKMISPEIGISNPAVLLNQLCKTNHQHKLGAEDLERILIACQPYSIRILETLASRINCVIIPLPEGTNDSDSKLCDLYLRCGEAFGEIAHALNIARDPNGAGGTMITIEESDTIEVKIFKATRIFQELKAHVRKESGQDANRPKLTVLPAHQRNTIINQGDRLSQGGHL